MASFRIITNNPLVKEKFGTVYDVEYEDVSYKEILLQVRAYIQSGHALLTHPLSGSIKPNETPYKSVMIAAAAGTAADAESEGLIENSILSYETFTHPERIVPAAVAADYQYVDFTLIAGAVESASRLGH